MQNTAHKIARRSSVLVPSIIVGFVLVYLLFPFLFLAPIVLIFGEHDKAPPHVQTAVRTAFVPIRYLSEKFPAYRLLISKESELTGIR